MSTSLTLSQPGAVTEILVPAILGWSCAIDLTDNVSCRKQKMSRTPELATYYTNSTSTSTTGHADSPQQVLRCHSDDDADTIRYKSLTWTAMLNVVSTRTRHAVNERSNPRENGSPAQQFNIRSL